MFILILILIIFSIWFYLYPCTKYIANKNLDKYISRQNIDVENILSIKENWDYPKYQYYFLVTYKDQIGYKYKYEYSFDYSSDNHPFKIELTIFRDENLSKGYGYAIENMFEIKYPPLNQEKIKK